MITHTETFETLATVPIKQLDVQILQNAVKIWDSSDFLMSVKIDIVGAFLGTATKKATVKLLGIIETASVEDVLQVKTGLYNSDPGVLAFVYISQGFFIVDEIQYDYEAGSTTIVMYDHMWKATNSSYTDTSSLYGFTYPSTVEGLATQMASAIGTELMDDFSSLPNADFTIQSDPYATISNVTLQNVIQEIAAVTGTTARISDTTLVFSQYTFTNGVSP